MAIKKYSEVLRYMEGSKAVTSIYLDRLKLQPVALSCMLSIGACKLAMSNWQGATDSVVALEVDPSNTKALYCRAQGWQGLKEGNQALADLKKA